MPPYSSRNDGSTIKDEGSNSLDPWNQSISVSTPKSEACDGNPQRLQCPIAGTRVMTVASRQSGKLYLMTPTNCMIIRIHILQLLMCFPVFSPAIFFLKKIGTEDAKRVFLTLSRHQ